jgi:NAD(P)-dependent dehydrogenase (short-subunit alcohol dehydrogenase family)
MNSMEISYRAPNGDLTGRTALVTGATKGLGYGMALALAKAGADIIVVSRHAEDCERVAKEIEGMDRKALSLPADVMTLEGINDLVTAGIKGMGKIDILVNNAGVGITKSAFDVSEADWDRIMDINLKAVFFLSQAVAKHYADRRYDKGTIINISSAGGLRHDANVLPYYTSKAAVIHLTKLMAVEWARHNIRVNCVCPGYVATPLNEREFNNPEIVKKITQRIPMRRLGEVWEIVGIIPYLASDAAGYVTGGIFSIDGGFTLT